MAYAPPAMRAPMLQRRKDWRLADWLCALVALVLSLAPAQGFVVCLEPDGSVALEPASAGCAGCPDSGEPEPASSSHAPDGECCPCVDIPIRVPGAKPAEGRARAEDPGWISLPAPAPPSAIPAVPAGAPARAERPREALRPALALRCLRSVVLHV